MGRGEYSLVCVNHLCMYENICVCRFTGSIYQSEQQWVKSESECQGKTLQFLTEKNWEDLTDRRDSARDLNHKHKYHVSKIYRYMNVPEEERKFPPEMNKKLARWVGINKCSDNHPQFGLRVGSYGNRHDEAVINFIIFRKESGPASSVNMIKGKARELAKEMGRPELKCSNRWWPRFKKQRTVKSGKM